MLSSGHGSTEEAIYLIRIGETSHSLKSIACVYACSTCTQAIRQLRFQFDLTHLRDVVGLISSVTHPSHQSFSLSSSSTSLTTCHSLPLHLSHSSEAAANVSSKSDAYALLGVVTCALRRVKSEVGDSLSPPSSLPLS